MAKKQTDSKSDLVKRLIKQISGNLTEEDELIPEVAIEGTGEMWCWDPARRTHFGEHLELFSDLGYFLVFGALNLQLLLC